MLERRKPQEKRETFWPVHAFQAVLVMLLVFTVLVLLAVFSPPPHESVARPADTSYIPRPEWYFLPLFEMLKFFPGKLEVVGAVIVPALAVLALLLLPFFDRSPVMKPFKRPLATAIGAVVFVAIVSLTIKGVLATPPSLASRPALVELGNSLYQEEGCANCHTINGIGSPVGPDLAGLDERRSLSWVHKYIEDPLVLKPDSAMPGYLGVLAHEEIEAISMYLLSLEKTPAPTDAVPATKEEPPALAPSGGPPPVPHTLEGRTICLACHETGIGEAVKIPTDHSGRGNDVCISCHTGK